MHVAYIHQHFSTPRGATGTRSYEMARRLVSAGHRVTMICGAYEAGDQATCLNRRVMEFEVAGIRVLRVPELYGNRMGFTRRVIAFGRFARTATRLVKGLDADLVFATSTPLTVGIPGVKGSRKLGVPFVFEVRDLWPELAIALGVVKNPVLKWYLRRLERNIYTAADRIIALAPGIRDGIQRAGYPGERIVLIPNSSDLDLFRPSDDKILDARFGSPDDFRLVFTGAHGLANGLDAVLDAVAELKHRGVTGCRFIFIGQGGKRDALMKRSRNQDLDSMVTWLEPIPKDELARILPRMDVGLMILKNVPAFYFGTSPNKFFDYIASGLPVLTNYPGWVADLITQNRCGMAVPPDDPRAFAGAVVELRDHRERRRAMGRSARLLAESQFSRSALSDQLVAVLEGVYYDHHQRRTAR